MTTSSPGRTVRIRRTQSTMPSCGARDLFQRGAVVVGDGGDQVAFLAGLPRLCAGDEEAAGGGAGERAGHGRVGVPQLRLAVDHAEAAQDVADRVHVMLDVGLAVRGATALDGDGGLAGLEDGVADRAAPLAALPDQLVPGGEGDVRRQLLVAALEDDQRRDLAVGAAGVQVDHGVDGRHDLLDEGGGQTLRVRALRVAREDPVEVEVVDAARAGGRLEGRGVHAGDADDGAAQGGGVDLGEDAPDGLLAVVLVAVDARVHTQDRAVLGAVDDDQRNAELHAVAAGADRDEAVGALAGATVSGPMEYMWFLPNTWIRCGTRPRRGCPR